MMRSTPARRDSRCGKGASAGVNADYQSNSGSSRAFDHIAAQVIAFANTVRHMEVSDASAQFDRCSQYYDRGSAVNVVVAVNQNSLLALDGGIQPLDRGFHASHQVWRVKVINRGKQKNSGGFRALNFAKQEELRKNRI